MANKKKYQKKKFESTGINSDVSSNIYESMILSPAWQDLSNKQQLLYMYCKLQYYSEKTIHENDNETFTMNRSKWKDKYKLYTDNTQRYFYSDMTSLIEHGFIKCVKCGQTSRQKNIYAYSSKWKIWNTQEFKLDNNELTISMLNNKYK